MRISLLRQMDHPKRANLIQRWFYRGRQFWEALFSCPSEEQLQRVQEQLSPGEFALFKSMQPGEQHHSIQVLERLEGQGQSHPSLLAAALLHDVGKSRYPLRVWERVFIVLAQGLLPVQAHAWGHTVAEKPGWRKAFIVARHHPAWGAELAIRAGSTPLTASLISRHQDELGFEPANREDELLALLQTVDDTH